MRAPFVPRIESTHDASNFCPPPEEFRQQEEAFPDDPELQEMIEQLDRLFNEI